MISKIVAELTKLNFDSELREKLYLRILELDANNVIAHGQLSIIYGRRSNFDRALKHYRRTRKLNPSFSINDTMFAELDEKWKKIIIERKKKIEERRNKPAEPIGKLTYFK